MTSNALPPSATNDLLGVLSTTVTSARSLEELVRPLLEILQVISGLESTYLTTVDEHIGVQQVLFARNTRALSIPEGLSVPWEGTLCKRALEQNLLYTDDVANCWGDCEAAKALGIATYVSSPVRNDNGELLGTLCAASDERRPMSTGADNVLSLFAKLISQQMEREKLFVDLQRTNHLLASNALIDPVTRLPNRRALMEDMQRRLSAGLVDQTLIAAFLDLDDFKAINDQYGHDVGDKFLEAIAQRLQSVLRAGDLAARLGGDEFVVLVTTPVETADAMSASLERRLAAATRGRFAFVATDFEYHGPSIGVVVAPLSSQNAEAILKAADEVMYAVKRIRKAKARAHHAPTSAQRA